MKVQLPLLMAITGLAFLASACSPPARKVDVETQEDAAVGAQAVVIEISESGILTWDGERVRADQLAGKFRAIASIKPQPDVRIIPHPHAQYDQVRHVYDAGILAGMSPAAMGAIYM